MTSIRCSIRISVTALFALSLVHAAPATAQSNAVLAENLFREGRKLLEEKRYDEACPKFAESARLDLSSGVELALGLCYEGQGKTASAWGAYVIAASLARRDKRRDREKAAIGHATELESKVSHVTVALDAETAKLPELEVRLDGIALGAEAMKDVALDPGGHTLEVSAPGKQPHRATFAIDAGSLRRTVSVPALVDEVAPAPHPPPVVAPPVVAQPEIAPSPAARSGAHAPSNALRTVGVIVGGAGVASVLAGSILGVVAISKAHGVNAICSPPTCSNAQAVADNGTAGTLADWSTATLIAGGAGIALGGVFVLLRHRASDAPPKAARLRAFVGLGTLGVGGDW